MLIKADIYINKTHHYANKINIITNKKNNRTANLHSRCGQ
ncbi:hypothetical protein AXX16_1566 [Serratia rubidaea]|nr:hypothetical protein AXX16_1566 [Serratia rubidaea]